MISSQLACYIVTDGFMFSHLNSSTLIDGHLVLIILETQA
jgi:hypothetical protein